MRVLFTGQTGIDKKPQLQKLKDFCAQKGNSIDAVFNVGDIMYAESEKSGAPLKEGKILDLPEAQLGTLRRGAFNLVRNESSGMQNLFVNSHAVFRWNNRLFRAFELPEIKDLRPDIIVTLIDDVEAVKMRLDEFKSSGALPPDTKYSLKDLLVWREEEMIASEILASVLDIPHYVLGVSLDEEVSLDPLEVVHHLMFESWRRKTYVSYPISEARVKQDIWEKVIRYRRLVRSYLTAFDPLMIREKGLLNLIQRQEQNETEDLEYEVRGKSVLLSRQEIEAIIDDIDGQIVARDYKLIDQSDMVVAYFPANTDGSPLIAGGVQSEIEHAAASTKEIIIVWEAPRDPTPFIGLRGDTLLKSLDELEDHLKSISQRPGQQEMTLK